jgi:hypothetical protein
MFLVPRAGLEPACGCPRWILSPLRLPFRHLGISNQINALAEDQRLENQRLCPKMLPVSPTIRSLNTSHIRYLFVNQPETLHVIVQCSNNPLRLIYILMRFLVLKRDRQLRCEFQFLI